MVQKASFAPVDRRAEDRSEADRLDLELHARLEAGLIDSFPASGAVSAAKPAPTVERGQIRSVWKAIKKMFK